MKKPSAQKQPASTVARRPGTGRLRALRPLGRRDFRILITALSISIFGSGMWAVTMVYQVIALGGGPAELSLVAALAGLGLVSFVLLGGIAADRLPRRLILISVEALNLLALASVTLLALTGRLQLWQVAAAATMLGIASAFFFPAYSAILPRILPSEELLAANGMEGTIRPVLQQAAGPAVAGMVIAATSPGLTAALIAAAHTIAFSILLRLRSDNGGEPSAPARPSVWADLREGVAYTVRTPWLLWTLLYAVVLLLLLMGPLEVLLPFAIRQQLGGGAATFGFMLAMFGIGGAAGALTVSSFRLPRRYLTLMMLLWGFGTVPMGILGLTNSFWLMAAALATCGFTWAVAQVIWGTLLQRRVPPHLLGRVSSLDFFVSLALMPVSMALAGPVAEVVPIWLIYVVVAVASPVLAIAAILIARMPQDEIAHPLDTPAEAAAKGAQPPSS
ncbi:MFS transporter [Arthrobacter sp. VKM Ac-2550]|uniref:MFS transporter n=1 Tax=Crystallibacter permensis TaxID=1938888 RepID=UPI002225F4D4|nr:MFS transporter [Arthrobacter sp. VKM Ac-2550]MCW2134804.1 putative arabinose efflux permease, MFS family [Arthrobacter sp. VKM Ac-2550]